MSYHRGYAIPEYSFVNYVTTDPVQAIELAYSKRTQGKNFWEALYNYPEFGAALFYSTLGNKEVFGEEVALTGFFTYYFSKKGRLQIYNRTGIGLGYATRKYHPEENYLNVAVGSHFNIHFNMRFGAKIDLMDRLALSSGLAFDHFSNGNTSEPNLGVNTLTAFMGLSYQLNETSNREATTIPQHENHSEYYLFLSTAGNFPGLYLLIFIPLLPFQENLNAA
ncbi:MAG: acyloxyacyl hydrolase [Luteibaculum sp.]